MAFDEGFVEEVRLAPKDDNARLILADYLEESGDPRGEFIRIQVELAGLQPMDESRRQLEARERELLEAFGERWMQPLRNLGAEGVSVRCFQRGLVERIKISAKNFLQHGAELCRIAPAFHCLQLREMSEHLTLLFDHEMPPQITNLDVSSQRLGTVNTDDAPLGGGWTQFTKLFQAIWISQLSNVNLSFNRLSNLELLEYCDLSNLEILDLSSNSLGLITIRELILNPTNKLLSNLQELHLKLNSFEWDNIELPLERLEQIRILDFSSTRMTDNAFESCFARGSFKSLETLVLRGNNLGPKTIELLHSPGKFENLKHLDLRNTGITAEGLGGKFGDGLIV